MTLDTDRDFAERGDFNRPDVRTGGGQAPAPALPLDWSALFGRRLFVLACLVLGWAVVIEARLFHLQVVSHEWHNAKAREQQQDRETVAAARANILDRNGKVLAMSVRGFGLEASRQLQKDAGRDEAFLQQLVQDPDGTAAKLCAVLARCTPHDRGEMAALMRMPLSSTPRRFVMLRHEISAEEAQRITALDLPGVRAVHMRHRYYPNGETASHIIGYVDVSNVGRTGLEHAFDTEMAGIPGSRIVELTNISKVKRLSARVLKEPIDGITIEATIDRELQYIAERELAAAVAEHRALGGCVVIMDPWNGEILAMASAPTFDPNRPGEFKPEVLQNRCAQHIYEPGSTFKVVTAAAAIEAGHVPLSRSYDVSAGHITLANSRVYDFHRYNQLSFTDVFVKSSNVGAIKIGLDLGPEVISRYVSRFGFGEILSKHVSHQRAGIVDRNMSKFGPRALGSVSMGYQIGVTPLQMVAAVSSVANGGELLRPRLARALIANGTRNETPREVVRRTISRETAATLTPILEQVVDRGTATLAKIEGYTIAGKTGTAAKLVNGRYSKSEYNASFVGFLPSRNPRVAMLVVIDSPHGKGYTGGVVAAPVFKRVGEATLRYLGIPPNVGGGSTVLVENSRPAGAMVPIPVRASVEAPARETRVATAAGTVPDVRGLSAPEAMRILARAGIEVRISGDGIVARQGLDPGEPIVPGQVCTLSLRREMGGAGDEIGTQP